MATRAEDQISIMQQSADLPGHDDIEASVRNQMLVSPEKEKHSLGKNWPKLLIVSLITLTVIVGSLVFLILRPGRNLPGGSRGSNNNPKNPNSGNTNSGNSTNPPTQNETLTYPTTINYDANGIPILPDLDPSFLTTDINTFDDSKAPNINVPPLNQQFPYGNKPIRGVNLGGWLVLDPLITPSHFNQSMIDEYTLVSSLGKELAKKVMEAHYNTFVTQEDFENIAKYGLDHVRIPLGFWAVETLAGEPYVPFASWQFLLRGINWARQYGLRVMVGLQAVPASQGDGKNTGRQGHFDWRDEPPSGVENSKRTLRIIKALATFFRKPEYINVVTLFEPDISLLKEDMPQFYRDSYNTINDAYAGKSMNPAWLVFDQAFEDLDTLTKILPEVPSKMLDLHQYMVFTRGFPALSQSIQLAYPCVRWTKDMTKSEKNFGPTIAGEFVAAVDDCAVNLNGADKVTSRYNGACKTCTCKGQNDWKNWSKGQIDFVSQLGQAQIDAFEQASGWFYWTWKTENNVNPKWDYQLAVQQGWFPRDPANRNVTCASLKKQAPQSFQYWQ